jgi:hypothetical protein
MDRLANLDRRWLFLAMAFAVVVPLLVPFSLPFRVSRMTQNAYDRIEELEPGSRVLVSVDYDPAARPEIEPSTKAMVRHLLRRRAKLVFVTFWAKAPPMLDALIRDLVETEYASGQGFFAGTTNAPLVYGTDYASLGFKEGKEAAIGGLGQDLRRLFPSDARGRQLSELPIFTSVQTVRDFDLVFNASAGFPGAKEFVEQIVARHHVPFVTATTAVSMTELTPYHPTHIRGLVAGMRGAAEYEQLLGYQGLGTRGLNVLTVGQLLVIAAIVLGNIIYFREKWRGAR